MMIGLDCCFWVIDSDDEEEEEGCWIEFQRCHET